MTPQKVLAFALGPIGAAVLGLVTVPMLTWFFSPEDIGRITMLQIAITFCLLLLGLGLDQAYVREYSDAENKAELLFNTLTPGFLLLTVALVPFVIWPSLLSLILFNIDNNIVGLLVLFILIGSFVSRFLSLLLRMTERGIAFSLSQVLPKLVFIIVIASFALLSIKTDFLKLISAHFISINLILLLLLINTRIECLVSLKQKFNFLKIKEMLSYSLPLILSGVAYWGLTTADKIFIRNLSSFNELGVYSVAVSFAAVASVFQGIFGLLWSPWIYKILAEDKITHELIARVQRKTSFIVVLIFCVMGMFSWLIDFILLGTYKDVKYIVVACIGLPLFYTMSEVTGVGVGITKKTMLFMWATFVALFISLALNYFLVPIYGAAGAAVSTCASLWIFFVLKTEISNHLWISFSRFNSYFLPTICLNLSILMALRIIDYKFILVLWAITLTGAIFLHKKDFLDILRHGLFVLKRIGSD